MDEKGEMRFEELLRQALQEDHADELEKIPSEADLAEKVVFSKRHQRRMQKLFDGDSAVLESRGQGMSTRRLMKILIVAALLAGVIVLGMMVYSYFNPFSSFFPFMEDLKSISGGSSIRDGSLELAFTENIRVFSGIEDMENELHTGAMYPRPEEQEAGFSVLQVRYAEFPDNKVVLISLDNGCTVSVYLKSPAYWMEHLPEDSFQTIAGRFCCVLDVNGGVQAMMSQDGFVYVVVAPDRDVLEDVMLSIR